MVLRMAGLQWGLEKKGPSSVLLETGTPVRQPPSNPGGRGGRTVLQSGMKSGGGMDSLWLPGCGGEQESLG